MLDNLYLVDSSVWLQVLPADGAGSPLRARVDALLSADVVATTGIVKLELLGGARTEAEHARLGRLLSALHLLPIEEERWNQAGQLGFQLRRQGITVPATDLLIAAVALHAGALLVHRDRHFDLIAGRFPLQVESHLP